MRISRAPSQHLLDRITGGLSVPGLAKAGAAVIAFGLLWDLDEHAFVAHLHDQRIGAFPLAEHAAHLVVLVGMVLVLVGVIADGVRSHRRRSRQEGSTRDAVR